MPVEQMPVFFSGVFLSKLRNVSDPNPGTAAVSTQGHLHATELYHFYVDVLCGSGYEWRETNLFILAIDIWATGQGHRKLRVGSTQKVLVEHLLI